MRDLEEELQLLLGELLKMEEFDNTSVVDALCDAHSVTDARVQRLVDRSRALARVSKKNKPHLVAVK